MSMLSQMKTDTTTILSDWSDSIKVSRNTATYTNAIGADIWSIATTYIGDWQPYSGQRRPGKDIVSESGIKDEYLSEIYLQFDADVEIGDRIYKTDTYYEYVSVIDKHEDHIEVFTKRNKNSI